MSVFGFVIALINIAAWLYFHRQVTFLFPQHRRWLRWASPLAFVILFHSSLLMVVMGRRAVRTLHAQLPDAVAMAFVGVQFMLWMCVVALILGFVMVRGIRVAQWLRGRMSQRNVETLKTATNDIVETRRRTLAAVALTLPVAAMTVTTGGMVASRQLPVVRRVQVPVRRELTELHGLKIAK